MQVSRLVGIDLIYFSKLTKQLDRALIVSYRSIMQRCEIPYVYSLFVIPYHRSPLIIPTIPIHPFITTLIVLLYPVAHQLLLSCNDLKIFFSEIKSVSVLVDNDSIISRRQPHKSTF